MNMQQANPRRRDVSGASPGPSAFSIIVSNDLIVCRRQFDGVLSTFDQHEESVYTVAWSAADPWVFASLSNDGRTVISLVPNDVKYKIIL